MNRRDFIALLGGAAAWRASTGDEVGEEAAAWRGSFAGGERAACRNTMPAKRVQISTGRSDIRLAVWSRLAIYFLPEARGQPTEQHAQQS